MDTDTVAARIVANVARRGYLPEERPVWQIVVRQAEKLTEEVDEFAQPLKEALGLWTNQLHEAAREAKAEFDKDGDWDAATEPTAAELDRAWAELVDIYIVVRVAEYALNAARGTFLSLDEAALLKSAGDIERGVRNGK